MSEKPRYLNYTTPAGTPLAQVARSGWSAFLIHDCGFRPALSGWNHPGVDSPFWRFYHNLTPGAHILHQGQKISLEPGSCLLIPANTVFDCCSPAPADHLWIHFTVTRLGGPSFSAPVQLQVDDGLRVLIQAVLDSHAASAPGEQRAHQLYHLASAVLHMAFARLPLPASPALPDHLLDILTLIQKAPHSQLSNSFLADRAGMPLEKFIRAFREHTGQTPAAYVIATRLRLAGEALVLTDKSIDQIAIEHGFPNRHYFSRMFTRDQGCGPAEFRARQGRKRGR